MTIIRAILRKELRELAATRSVVIAGVLASAFFSLVLSSSGLEEVLFSAPLLVGLFLGYYGCSHVFLREKTDFVIETLLCSPATLRDLWVGKTLAVTVFADVFALGLAAVTVALTSLRAGGVVVPAGDSILYLIVALPLTIACLVGVRGYLQLLFGMRGSHLLSFGLLMIALLLLRGLGLGSIPVSSDVVAMACAATGILVVLWLCSRFLSPERILTTL